MALPEAPNTRKQIGPHTRTEKKIHNAGCRPFCFADYCRKSYYFTKYGLQNMDTKTIYRALDQRKRQSHEVSKTSFGCLLQLAEPQTDHVK